MKKKISGCSNCINRRDFIGGSTMLLGGLSLNSSIFPASAFAQSPNAMTDFNPLFKKKLRVRFVICGLIHDTAHEGPCRIGSMENLTREADIKKHQQNLIQRKELISSRNFPEEVELLPTVDFKMLVKERDCHFRFPDSEISKVAEDIENTDLLVTLDGFNGQVGIFLAEKFNKPVATVTYSNPERLKNWGRDIGGWLVDMKAGLQHKGLEGYLAYDWEDLDQILKMLWVKKAFSQSSALVISDRYGKTPHGLGSVFYHFDDLKEMYGMGCVPLSNQDAVDRMKAIKKNPAESRKADKLTEALISKANALHTDKKFVRSSVIYYMAIKSLMDENDCNCFGVGCREVCPLEIAEDHKITPCLTHTLLKDSGYPSACQLDFNAMTAMMAMSYLSKKSAYMGNPEYYKEYQGMKNILSVWHSVPGMKMKGFENESLPFELRNFTAQGFGPTMKYNFGRDKGETVTLGRFNPSFNSLLVTKGTIQSGYGMHRRGCSLGVNIQVKDIDDVFEKTQDYGSHLVMVYGDYTQQLKRLGKIMNFGVVQAGC
ncbi:L-fucose isomerase [Sedimentisphaera cyanobacteriorum]|uniref:L-fucose isomerase n=1 Tax=Sedimentisphaera cyanobacteriorum TaxID=1940790 RepID=A0A1Q2HQK9_9BACT|nr:hypothetical protein [Sedimentisphaera cyanobacteriorum]AQQ09692.1 L-fucose isomerase [Sedimentisphaera cyanobacteriorum]